MSDTSYSLILVLTFCKLLTLLFYSRDLAACFDVCFDTTRTKEASFFQLLFMRRLKGFIPLLSMKLLDVEISFNPKVVFSKQA